MGRHSKGDGSLLLLSGGLDSSVAGLMDGRVHSAITINYGQPSARREIAASASYCRRRNIQHDTVNIPWYATLVRRISNNDIPHPAVDSLNNGRGAQDSARSVWYPQRNLLFLSIAAAIAEARGLCRIVAGFNAEEAHTFPDNSRSFVQAFDNVLKTSGFERIKLSMPTIGMLKKDIAALAPRLGLKPNEIWSCYKGGARHCGRCESCVRLALAAKEVGWQEMLRRFDAKSLHRNNHRV